MNPAVKLIFKIIVALIVTSIVLWIVLLKPYTSFISVRIDNSPVTQEVEFYTLTGEDPCSKLYVVENEVRRNIPVFVNVPVDIIDPHDYLTLKDDDRILLTGYRYEYQTINHLTGDNEKRSSTEFDLVSWNIVGGQSTQTKLDVNDEKNFEHKNYNNCMH